MAKLKQKAKYKAPIVPSSIFDCNDVIFNDFFIKDEMIYLKKEVKIIEGRKYVEKDPKVILDIIRHALKRSEDEINFYCKLNKFEVQEEKLDKDFFDNFFHKEGIIINTISSKSFESHPVTEIYLDYNTTTIESFAFENCNNLKKIVIYLGGYYHDMYDYPPIHIKSYAFNNCPNLETIEIIGSGDLILDNNAFNNCPNICKITTTNKTQSKITLGENCIISNYFNSSSKLHNEFLQKTGSLIIKEGNKSITIYRNKTKPKPIFTIYNNKDCKSFYKDGKIYNLISNLIFDDTTKIFPALDMDFNIYSFDKDEECYYIKE